MSIVFEWYERHFMRTDVVASVLITAAFWLWVQHYGGAAVLNTWLQGNRGDVYGTVASILGTLLGFVITVVSILLSLWPAESLALIRQSPATKTLWAVMKSCTRWLAIATVLAVVTLIFDRDGATKPSLLTVTAFTVILSGLRFLRTLWILERVIVIVAKPMESSSAAE